MERSDKPEASLPPSSRSNNDKPEASLSPSSRSNKEKAASESFFDDEKGIEFSEDVKGAPELEEFECDFCGSEMIAAKEAGHVKSCERKVIKKEEERKRQLRTKKKSIGGKATNSKKKT